jgi:hypothetical protein
MAACRARRSKHPALLPYTTSFSQKIKDPPTHWNEPSPFKSFAIWHEDQPVFPFEVLNAHSVEFALISHSRIAHQDDDVTKEIARSLSPLATGSPPRAAFFPPHHRV